MEYEDKDISNKSQMITLILLILFGSLGAHRIYVGKFATGILIIVLSSIIAFTDYLGVGYSFIFKTAYMLFILIDMYALYSDSFTDSKGLLVVGKSKTLIYDSYEEREKIIFEEKLNKIMLFCLAIAAYLVYFILSSFVL